MPEQAYTVGTKPGKRKTKVCIYTYKCWDVQRPKTSSSGDGL